MFHEKSFIKIAQSLLIIVFLFQNLHSQTEKTFALEVGKTTEEREIAGTEIHKYQITPAANQLVSFNVEQRGVDLTLTLFAPNGEIIAEINADSTAKGTEKAEFVAETSGNFRLEIKASLPKTGNGKYLISPAETKTATADDKLLDEARRKYFKSLRFIIEGNFDQAIELAKSSLEIREKILGANHADTQTSESALSRVYLARNNVLQADVFARRAVDSALKIFGAASLDYADALSVLGRVRLAQTNFIEAERLQIEALAIREKASGAESFPSAISFHSLGFLYRAMNDYPKSEANFTRALTIYEKLVGENNLQTAQVLNDFGMFYYGAGDFQKSFDFLLRSLAIKEKLFQPNHRQIGIALNNLGLIAWKKLDYKQAKTFYGRALKIFEIVNGAESDGVANILFNLGVIYKEGDGDYPKAEEFYNRSLAITKKTYGEFNIATGNILSSLAILYRSAGDLERAEQFGLRALTIYEKVLGEYNHYTILALGNQVRIYAAKGETVRAVETLKRLIAIHEKVVPLNLRSGSERQKIAYYAQTNRFDNIITLHAGLGSKNPEMRDIAITTILQHKGRVLDAVSSNLSALRERFDEADRKLLDDLNDVNSRLSKVISTNRQKISAEEQQKQIKTLEIERDKLEAEISRRSAGFYQSSQPVTLESVRNLIPSDAALVEYAVYRPFKWNARQKESDKGEPRYIAYVVRREGDVQWTDLGETKTIDAAIKEWRKALRDPKRTDVKKLARAVDEKLFQPIRPFFGNASHILVSPDGELQQIPFEALVGEKNNYLIENYLFTYLTSGRDLLRMKTAGTSKSKSLIFANPNFGETSDANSNTDIRAKTVTRDVSETFFAPLGGTLQEARSIQTIFPDTVFLNGTDATETALKKISAPELLHIATHGYFLQNTDETKIEIENPLLRSGLAFAGANLRAGGAGDDGILTALEASGLNLWGTKSVVLSACDTGLGEVKNGEGVYGLRRAFTLAGTESLVMSLWAVSDFVTREMMTNYYKNLKSGMGRGASLRQSQLEMMKKREHPFYWAAFINSGEWANLEGKR